MFIMRRVDPFLTANDEANANHNHNPNRNALNALAPATQEEVNYLENTM